MNFINTTSREEKDGMASKSDSPEPKLRHVTEAQPIPNIDPKMERRIVMKIDLAILPLICIMYLFCFIDRANIGKQISSFPTPRFASMSRGCIPTRPHPSNCYITYLLPKGNARIAGLEKDLNLKGYDFNIALTCFTVVYTALEAPATVCCKWVGPGWFLPGCTIGFGIASFATGLVHNRGQLFAVRCILGAFECGMFPGIAYYLSRWYRRAELGFRLSLYVATAPMAGAFGGLLASAILRLPGFGGMHGWRLIFAIEGLISLGLGVVGFLFLTDRPETARWLTPEERRMAADRITAERIATTALLDKIDRVRMRRGVTNPVVLGTGIMFFMDNLTVQGLSFFLPTIVSTIYPDRSVTTQQLFTVPPYILGIFFTIAASALSWRLDRRHVILTLSALPVLVAYAMFVSTLDPQVRYAAAFFVASSSFIPGSMSNAQVSANVVSDTSRSLAIGLNVAIAALGVSDKYPTYFHFILI